MKANRAEIIDELEALGQHYMRPVRGEEQQARFLKDYLDDLAEYPISAIKLGCKAWRGSAAAKFPTTGQLLPLVRANTVTEGRGDKPEPWRPLADAEYDRLSLRDKIRHHRILAVECRRQAGPMWRNGGPVAPENMPDRYTELIDRADGHDATAQQLRATIKRLDGVA